MYKKIVLGALALVTTLSFAAQSDPRVSEWAKLFYVDAKLNQDYLNAIASFICYMSEKQPSEECFNRELKKVNKVFKGAPRYFQQSLVRLFSNSFSEAYTKGSVPDTPDQRVWQSSLQQYYRSVYPLLDASHKTINYGNKKGSLLPMS